MRIRLWSLAVYIRLNDEPLQLRIDALLELGRLRPRCALPSDLLSPVVGGSQLVQHFFECFEVHVLLALCNRRPDDVGRGQQLDIGKSLGEIFTGVATASGLLVRCSWAWVARHESRGYADLGFHVGIERHFADVRKQTGAGSRPSAVSALSD